MTFRQLAGLTPIAFDAASDLPLVWADLRPYSFDQPFFSRIMKDWRARSATESIRTDLSALVELEDQPSLDPDLVIAHPSRSGSTLLARLAAAADGTILVSEPSILPQVLNQHRSGGLGSPIEPVLRAIVRALGRIRPGNERRYVLKLNSQITRFLPEFQRALPQTPIVWLQRQPIEILESNLHFPPAAHPGQPGALEAWLLRRITLAFLGATAFVDSSMRILDYRDLPHAAWTSLAELMGVDPAGNGVLKMREIAQYDARTGARFEPRSRNILPTSLQAIVRETLDPLYEDLRARRGH